MLHHAKFTVPNSKYSVPNTKHQIHDEGKRYDDEVVGAEAANTKPGHVHLTADRGVRAMLQYKFLTADLISIEYDIRWKDIATMLILKKENKHRTTLVGASWP